MAQVVTQALVAHIPFLLHIELRLTSSHELGIVLHCEDGVELSCGLTLHAYRSAPQILQSAMEAWAGDVMRAYGQRRAASWLATKQEGQYTALLQDGAFTHQCTMPLDQGYPQRSWRIPVPTRLSAMAAWVTSIPEAAPMTYRAYVLRNYDAITRVAWYEPA